MKKFIFAILLALLQSGFSQNNEVEELESTYSRYFELPREKVYLHLNKTSYLNGEHIWFTAYLYDAKTGLPFNKTTNLYCGLYNSEGKQLTKGVFYVNEGIAIGSFEVKPVYGNGDFFVKAHTKWMKNFKEDDSYVQKIEIRDGSRPAQDTELSENYGIQLLPEGGHMLSEARNTISFKLVDQNGRGVPFQEGKVVATDGSQVLEHIYSNTYGIGKFNFYYQENKAYSLVITLPNEKTITKAIPKAMDTGVVFSANNLNEEKITIALHTNAKTLTNIKGKDFHIAIHRDGLLMLNSFQFEGEEKTLAFTKDKLWPGINILTLFDQDLNPIAERLLFNNAGLKIGNVSTKIGRQKNLKDSLSIQLDLFSQEYTPTNLSISILPSETKANHPNNSITSAFLLRPYIKTQVENAPYYFRDMDRKKSYELDNLLLSQGWSKYDWTNVFTSQTNNEVSMEKGISLTGSVQNVKKDKRTIFLLEGSTNSQYVAKINDSGQFDIPNAIVFKDSPVSAILFDGEGKPSKPKVELKAFSAIEPDDLDIGKYRYPEKVGDYPSYSSLSGLETNDNENIITLENVTVSTEMQKKFFLRNSSMTGLKITDEKGTLANFIRKLGFRTFFDYKSGLTYAFYTRGPEKIPVGVIIDGINDFGFYDNSMALFDYVIYQSTHGPILVTSKRKKPLETKANILLNEGFERPKEYYNPKYSSYSSQDYLQYGSVHWEPALLVDMQGKTSLKIPKYGLENLKLYIEGMSQDGTLFSEVQTIRVN
ncbi:hypothetical protein FGM00_00940 [Aggregatimonas sangjinii]|uniref:Carboxypeptidase regulatory-like domain-containing protein n=1 Tax=Aggregatimonas sangjinii TaxID=2583587 RepID=A0A5B7SP22_9FLAO|nr:hypothetical protein [Aggregatimonas sangjinii]QCW98752.1 hypothetical protein FGM00_00940 [Aggregatimonas sangjinii]